MAKHSLLYSTKSFLNADGVSWCPFLNHKSVLALCMYELRHGSETETPKSVRVGGVEIYEFDQDLHHPTSRLIHNTQCGIFRMKWVLEDKPVLYAAQTNGNLASFECGVDNPRLSAKNSIQVSDGALLCLDARPDVSPEWAVCSDSNGSVFKLQLDSGQVSESWRAHSLSGSDAVEVWSVAADCSHNSVTYSGADDCMLKGWDTRTPKSPLFVNKSHSAGVTKILSHHNYPSLLLTGSYDEYLRIFDSRNFQCPLTEYHTCGGVWDLDWNPLKPAHLLAACMQGGWQILEKSDQDSVSLIYGSVGREELLYGVSFSGLNSGVYAVCSFYDRQLDVCSYQQ